MNDIAQYETGNARLSRFMNCVHGWTYGPSLRSGSFNACCIVRYTGDERVGHERDRL